MKLLIRSGLVGVGALALAGAFSGVAGADPPPQFAGPSHVVFVQTDNIKGNQVVAYDRASNGTLTLAGTYSTDGHGGQLKGSKVDHLASQGSLTYDEADNLLFAVNAGTNTVSVFTVRGDRLVLSQVIGSGGTFPVSVTVHGDLVYVLNALQGGSVQGYVAFFGRLFPLPGSNRPLGLTHTTTKTTQFTHTPGQVAFSPNGSQLIVTTKANGNDIDVFGVNSFGYLSPSAVVNSAGTSVPFAVAFDSAGHLLVAEAAGYLVTYTLNPNGTLALIDSAATKQTATCWLTPAGRFFYTSNAGSHTLSGFSESFEGQLTLIGDTTTNAGTVDASASLDGQYLYVQTGATGIVDEFHVNFSGSLTEIGSVKVATATGGEGIVAL